MLWSLVHWAVTVIAIGVVAGLVLAAAATVAFFWLRRILRRKFQNVAWAAAGNVGRRLAERRIGSGWVTGERAGFAAHGVDRLEQIRQ